MLEDLTLKRGDEDTKKPSNVATSVSVAWNRSKWKKNFLVGKGGFDWAHIEGEQRKGSKQSQLS